VDAAIEFYLLEYEKQTLAPLKRGVSIKKEVHLLFKLLII
jgi:hypothetical protein